MRYWRTWNSFLEADSDFASIRKWDVVRVDFIPVVVTYLDAETSTVTITRRRGSRLLAFFMRKLREIVGVAE